MSPSIRPATGDPAELDLLVLGDVNPDLVLTGEDLTPAFGQDRTARASGRYAARCLTRAPDGDVK